MKTTNWQTKALALFIAAVALWLTAACGSDDTTIEVQPAPATNETSTGAPTIATPTKQDECTAESPDLTSMLNTSEEDYESHLRSLLQANQVIYEHEALFWRQPNVYDVSTGFLRDGKGGWTDKWGIIVWVTNKVDQSTLPPENRLSDSLDNVLVQIVHASPPSKVSKSSCDYSICGTNLEKGEEKMTNLNANTTDRRHEIRLKYDPLFWRQPNVFGVGEGVFYDDRGEPTSTHGIIVHVSKKVDQSALPPEDRIPDCLEGIPVQVIEENPPELI